MEIQTAPLLSIVIPAYNSETHLHRTMNSLLLQNVAPQYYEIILVDDGSTDATLTICQDYEHKYTNVLVVHQENHGVSAARNRGIAMARGKWVTFVDSDDYVTPQYVQTITETAPHAECVIFDNYRESCEQKCLVKGWIGSHGNQDCPVSQVMPWFFDQRLNAPWDKRYNLEVIRKNHIAFPEELHMGEDLVFNVRYALCMEYVHLSAKAIYVYVDNSQGLTGRKTTPEKLKQLERSYDILFQLCTDCENDDVCRKMLDKSFLRVIARAGGQLFRAGLSCKTIACMFDHSIMVQRVLAQNTCSVKDWIRVLLLKNHLYQICSVIISGK